MANREYDAMKDKIEQAGNKQDEFNEKIGKGTDHANKLMKAVGGVVAAYATMQSVTKVINLSDEMSQTTARLDMMNDGLQTNAELQKKRAPLPTRPLSLLE